MSRRFKRQHVVLVLLGIATSLVILMVSTDLWPNGIYFGNLREIIIVLPLGILLYAFLTQRSNWARQPDDRGKGPPAVVSLPYVAPTKENAYAPERWDSRYQDRQRELLQGCLGRFSEIEVHVMGLRAPTEEVWKVFEFDRLTFRNQLRAEREEIDKAIARFRGTDEVAARARQLLLRAEARLCELYDKYGLRVGGSPRQNNVEPKPHLEQEFANVFFNLSIADRARTLERIMNQKGCNRTEAMRFAVEEWRQEQRWT